MSSSRSVAAAQRRRVGAPEPQPSRGPNTSIQSSQAFAPQIQPGTSGRLAGQHAALQQQQQQQQRKLQSNQNASTSKMTVPQAITLITLRLGRLENQLQNLDASPEVDEEGNITNSIDDNLLSNILERLDSLEKTMIDVASLKQQMELFKPTLVKNTSSTNALMKDVKEIKTNAENIKNDFMLTQSLVKDLQLLVNPPDLEEFQDETIVCVENNENSVNLKEIIEQELNS
jgi:hypothetical protein